jgi:phosphoglycolate phosphatase
MAISCVLFDFDGTLVDTAPEMADAVNATLRRIGRPEVSEAQVRGWIGHGAHELLGHALTHAGVGATAVATHRPQFAQDYLERCGTHSKPYPGVVPMLERLRESGLSLALLTNKESAFAHRVLVKLDLSGYFDAIVAGDTLPVKKPHPDTIRHALESLGASAEDTLYIGDSAVDVHTARAAGVEVWLVRHGYAEELLEGSDAPDRWIDDFDQLDLSERERVTIASAY